MPRHRDPVWRRRYLALAVCLLGVAGALVAQHVFGGTGAVSRAATRSSSCAQADSASCARVSARPSSPVPSPSASRRRATRRRSVRARRSRAPTIPAPAGTGPAAGGGADASVLAVINQARAAAGLPAYAVLAGLQTSSGRHNTLMASGCGLSHQCPGEPDLGSRETAAGVQWTAAGENIGEGGPVANTNGAVTQMAIALTRDMLAEQPPNDGHRLNLLSATFTDVGITVYRASDGTVWMTQDFSN